MDENENVESAESAPVEDNNTSSADSSSGSTESSSSSGSDNNNNVSNMNNGSGGGDNETSSNDENSESVSENDNYTESNETESEESGETSSGDGGSGSSSGGMENGGSITVICQDCNTKQIEKSLNTILKHMDEGFTDIHDTIVEYSDRPIWDTPIEEYTVTEGLLLCILIVLLLRIVFDFGKRLF